MNLSSFRILLPFSEHLRVLASKIQQFLTVFKIGLSLARFWGAFGISRVAEGLNPPRYATDSVIYVALCIKMRKIKVVFWQTKPFSAFVKSLFYLSTEIMKMKTLLWRSTYIKLLKILVVNFSWPSYVCVTLYRINQWKDTTLLYVTIIGRSVRYQVCKTTYNLFITFISNLNSRRIIVLYLILLHTFLATIQASYRGTYVSYSLFISVRSACYQSSCHNWFAHQDRL